MTSEASEDYVAAYRHNLGLAERLEERLPDDLGWTCVVRFYAALHLINAYLVQKENVRFDAGAAAHPDRKRAMDRCPELRDAPRKYRELKDLSESVRYDAGFQYTMAHHQTSKLLVGKIAAIVEPKLKRA